MTTRSNATGQLRAPGPIEVRDVFADDRAALVAMLRDFRPEDWARPTICAGWDVRDVALHILGGDLNNISRRRDGATYPTWGSDEDPGAFLARVNDEWVAVGRRFSPRSIIELLETGGPLLFTYFDALDTAALGGRVSWAGSGPAPVWLDVAREYMERWVHQQHIRDAVGHPGQTSARFMWPVVATSMHALPPAIERHAPDARGPVVVHVAGAATGSWSVVREDARWRLLEGTASDPRTIIEVDAEDWWRVVTLGLAPEEVMSRARVVGDTDLARATFSAVAIIA